MTNDMTRLRMEQQGEVDEIRLEELLDDMDNEDKTNELLLYLYENCMDVEEDEDFDFEDDTEIYSYDR